MFLKCFFFVNFSYFQIIKFIFNYFNGDIVFGFILVLNAVKKKKKKKLFMSYFWIITGTSNHTYPTRGTFLRWREQCFYCH